jgi:hopanoid biosynthesis associated protein HpnK
VNPARGLIITADDFGLSVEVNEAVEQGHRAGVLTCASLVVNGAAAADAVRRAKTMPGLGVGLHLALVDAPSALPAHQIPDLIDAATGALGVRPAVTGALIALSPRVREQARAEIAAQFELFRKTGLPLDHVDGHWHFHQHPWITDILIDDMAPRFGVTAVRVPNEPGLASWRAAGRKGLIGRATTAAVHAPLWGRLRRRLKHAGIGANDWFFGFNDGGAMDRDQLLRTIASLPPGVSEIGLHPASGPPSGPHPLPSHWRAADELAALIDPAVIEACRAVTLGRFADLVRTA